MWTVERGIPDPSGLANVETTIGTFAPGAVGKAIEHVLPPEEVEVQFGEVAVKGISVVEADTVKLAEFVALEIYCECRPVASDWFVTGIAKVRVAVADTAAGEGPEAFGFEVTGRTTVGDAGAFAPPPLHPLRPVAVKKATI